MRLVMSAFLILVVLSICSIAGVRPVAAQTGAGPLLGAELGRAHTFAGISARFIAEPFHLVPSVEASIENGLSRWRLNADLIYRLSDRQALVTTYVGAGLSLRNAPDVSVSPGANAIGGIGLALGPVFPFVQSRITVAGGTSRSKLPTAVHRRNV